MGETYCGKSCEDCKYKQELSCNGCKMGPGKEYGGECRLAQCCREKGHEKCETCSYKRNCGMWIDRSSAPKQRLEKIEEQKNEKIKMDQRAPFLGKWIWLLFWLVVPNEIAGLMVNETVLQAVPALENPGNLISMLCTLIYGLILLKIASEDDFYKTAGWCTLVTAGIESVLAFLIPSEAIGVGLFFSVVAIVFTLISAYHEYHAHADVVLAFDADLSGKWEFLWKLQKFILIGTGVSLVVIMIIPLLGALAVLALAIAAIVASILKLVYLYRTAQVFRKYGESKTKEFMV